jgi:fucose 4-O-acetylase-like acetyltransferase
MPMPGDTDILTPSNPARTAQNPRQKGPKTGRDESLDIAKGFGIILVVLGHCLDGLIASGFFSASVMWPTLAVYVIYLFHMPLFFVVSGHLASGKSRPIRSTLAKLLQTIVYPYFLWSILQGLTLVYFSKYTTSQVHVSSLYKILWAPIVPYWFLYALFFCHIGYLAVRRLSNRAQVGIAIAVFLIPSFYLLPLGGANLMIVPETTRGFLYFILGVVSVALVKQFGRWTALSATALFIVFAIVYYQSQFGGALAWIAALPAGMTGIIATLAWARMLAARRSWLVNMLAFCGRYSMSIYVTHIFFTAGVRIALKRTAIGWTGAAGASPAVLATCVEIVAATLVGVALPLGLNWLVSKLDFDQWLGLQHMESK